jgi:uncharacterized protein (DUF169 family)
LDRNACVEPKIIFYSHDLTRTCFPGMYLLGLAMKKENMKKENIKK